MKILVVNNAEPADMDYNVPLVEAVSQFADVEVAEYRELPEMRDALGAYGGVILSGVPIHYSYDTIDGRLPYLEWLKDTDVPVLGICLGHQNIGRLFGAELIVDIEAEEGLYPLQTLEDDELLQDIDAEDKILASHRGSISVPAGFRSLASTTVCKNHIMKHATKEIYGMQFHPEFSPAGVKLLGSFVRLAAKKAEQAVMLPVA